ncbi:hypothetical protein JT305_21925 [Salmonella enterica subsp. enterica serovar Senftenberg]|nr:hypothetical protein [Salmonella enterica subsp. enterica serovar Senftenberg]
MENLSLPTSPEALRKQAEQLLKAAEEAEKSAMRMTSSTKTPASEAGNMPSCRKDAAQVGRVH